jgi:septum formation protein
VEELCSTETDKDLWRVMDAIVLASGSQTRKQMLERAGLSVHVEKPYVDEDEIKQSFRAEGMAAAEVAEMLAELKASRVGSRYVGTSTLVIGADQMLECEGAWFDKPADRAGATESLRRLSGRTHTLISSVVVVHNGVRIWHHVDRAQMVMRKLSDAYIESYLDQAGAAVCQSVGAYQVEGLGAQLFNQVRGDIFTVLGLPLLPLLDFLRIRGVLQS